MTTAQQAVCLVSTLHDPDGRLAPALTEHARLLGWYAAVHVAATETTSPALLDLLRRLGAAVQVQPPGRAGDGLRSALRTALPSSDRFFVCDFDRWLHWSGRFPDELDRLPERIERHRPRPWLVCLGRTARAWATHPEVQRQAEAATNRPLTLAAGRRIDATAGACWLSPEGAALVLAESIEPTKATDLEWPALVLRRAPRRLAYLATEGLEFETATFYPAEIAAAGGLAPWLHATYDRPAVWRDRLRLAADSVAALTRVLASPPP